MAADTMKLEAEMVASYAAKGGLTITTNAIREAQGYRALVELVLQGASTPETLAAARTLYHAATTALSYAMIESASLHDDERSTDILPPAFQ